MSATHSPPRPHNRTRMSPHAAEISRARQIVKRLGGRLSLEVDNDVDREPPLERRVGLAARHLALPAEEDALRALADSAHVDFRDLEAALVRLARDHDFASCAGGEECPLASCEHGQFVHF